MLIAVRLGVRLRDDVTDAAQLSGTRRARKPRTQSSTHLSTEKICVYPHFLPNTLRVAQAFGFSLAVCHSRMFLVPLSTRITVCSRSDRKAWR